MGPDEFATRQELSLVFRLLLAKIQQHAELLSVVTVKLAAKGVITTQEFEDILAQCSHSPRLAAARVHRYPAASSTAMLRCSLRLPLALVFTPRPHASGCS